MALNTGLFNVAPGESAKDGDARRRLAMALMQEGMSTEPIRSPWQGAANIAKSLIGGYDLYQADEADKRKEASMRGAFESLPGMSPVAQALAPPPEPLPQRPQNPMPPGMIPGANGEPPRQKVASSASVMGDDEAIKAGLYEGSPSPGKPPSVAPAAGAPQQAVAMPQVAQAGPSATTRAAPTIPPEVQQRLRMLWANPETRGLAAQLYMEYGKPTTPDYNIHQREDGAVIATNKSNPSDMHVIKPPGAASDIAGFKGDVKRAEKVGEGQGTAAVGLGQATDNAQLGLKTINDIRNHPGKQYGTGVAGILPAIPGTQQAGFVDLVNQAKGQTFLQAYQGLKGGGQITEVEGAKAENAIARLNRARSSKDFDTALNDLESVIKLGLSRAQSQTRGIPSAPTGGVRKYNLETGKIE